jgi:putative endonuclease
MTTPTAYIQGIHAEARALNFLESKGLKCLGKRIKTPYGEIDLLMQDQEAIVAVEVKYRKSLIQASYALQPKQQMRIQNALQWWLSSHETFCTHPPMQRFDVVLICPGRNIKYYPNAWLADQ